MVGKKHFDFFELARQENGRFIVKEDFIDNYTRIQGLAARGTLDSSASWLLKKETILAGTVLCTEYADDAQFTQVWDDRIAVFGGTTGSSSGTLSDDFAIPAVRLLDTVLNFSVSGLQNSGRHQEVTINSTGWTALPATPLADRNAIAIQNNTVTDVKINHTTSVGYVGMLLVPGAERTYDIKDTIILYGRSAAGSVTLDVEEIS